MVIVEGGVPLMKSPFWLTSTFTVIVADGAGDAVSVNVAFVPSMTGEVPAEIVTCWGILRWIVVVVDVDGSRRWSSLQYSLFHLALGLLLSHLARLYYRCSLQLSVWR